jgi:hypothetical protein
LCALHPTPCGVGGLVVHRAHAVVITVCARAHNVRCGAPRGDQENRRRCHDRHVDKEPRDRHRNNEKSDLRHECRPA